ncbi:MAG TPA: FAD-dependent oxidoreductase, partial [Rhodanobacter sp.]|nr:FAD-dependent oxidoreductase [Rhodanobacter sp.]
MKVDVLIIGAGAAGLMCAIAAGQRGRRVLLVDHAN